ncbi:hypothetical protein [Saccharopolyspora sp. 6V]|uniref:VG15 protein n=1 Tax=Saccharopolyspora sp. 6V TaxID=2877239 RepID=UPI001CD480DE|nr:hypothetical protein [Saccharopolyspora sp. 6V]MCA1191623.1 hypothetical protein [Saccharopolyspora sp. 6V]
MAVTAEGALLTEEHRARQLAVRAAFLREFLALWPLLDPIRLDETAPVWLDLVVSLSERYRRESAARAAAYYAAFRGMEATELDPTLVALDLDALAAANAAVRTSLMVTGPIGIKSKTARGRTPEAAARIALIDASGAGSRHVLDAGREALREQVANDPAKPLWARITDEAPCDFCAMLASRGAVYVTRQSALHSSNRRRTAGTRSRWGEAYHDNCGCTAEPQFSGSSLPDRNVYYQALWESATKGKSGKSARAAFREALKADRATGFAPTGA